MFENSNFIHNEIDEDLKKYPDLKIHTRFPPEPSGYLHIGHAKAICIDFGTAIKYNGLCNLRMDDTNPIMGEEEYVESIKEDIKWLGFEWHDKVYYGSDYFDRCYEYAIEIIKKGNAYVCDLNADEIREYRGTLKEPGKNSPYRDRSIEENLTLFQKMKDGAYQDGKRTLRAKIDMSSPNMNLRDPVLYRIMHVPHSNTGDKWCIYPMYDYAHPIQDAVEGITHSLCDLEFEAHRPLYNWVLENLGYKEFPKQREFARLNVTYTVTSKRRLREVVNAGLVSGWDDPRLPTLAGLRRRGYTPASIRTFIDKVGVAKSYSVVDVALLEHCLRDELNKTACRAMAILDPLPVTITNYPDDGMEYIETENNPEDPAAGKRMMPFTKNIYIERSDFMIDPPRKFFRLSPGKEIRLKNAYFITCTGFDQDDDGNITEIYCTYDPLTQGGNSPDGRKVKGTLHWVSAKHAVDAEVRLYDRLFTNEDPLDIPEDKTLLDMINPDSLQICTNAKLEPMLGEAENGDKFQFFRTGYFIKDIDSTKDKPVYNRTTSLRDTWAKISRKG